ncbi:MAG: RNase P modulator RnpM [bacterium]
MKQRRIPLRMCVGCQEMRPKRELLRVVRTPEKKVEVDRTGKRSGRGAYICPRRECLVKAIQGKRLQKALETDLPPEIMQELEDRLVEI